MTKEEIVKYVSNSPENTNPNVLEGMLDQLDNGGSSSSGLSLAKVVFNMTCDEEYGVEAYNYVVVGIGEEYVELQSMILNWDPVTQSVVTLSGEGVYLQDPYFYAVSDDAQLVVDWAIGLIASGGVSIEDDSIMVNGDGTISGTLSRGR